MSTSWLQFGLTTVFSIGGAFLAVHLALSRFYRERWWERKLAYYSSVFDALHKLKSVYGEWEEIELEGKALTDEFRTGLREKLRSAEDELHKSVDVGPFFVSESSTAEISNFLTAMYRMRESSGDRVHIYANICALAEVALKELRLLALADLMPSPWYSWFTKRISN